MTDAAIFVFGCIVMLVVGAAFGVLLWGAYREKDVE
jgi:hypothetical protein